VDLTYRSSYELALDLAVREPKPDEELRPEHGRVAKIEFDPGPYRPGRPLADF
jgi:hypothetical protein